ncbi:MAG: LPS-assembly protein LptD [Pseudomonadales bacterium]|nr:LPS-assembly protein LptD [Pseudomonadales bacterium]MCP5343885.1 LPS-assembly protein LptD [Pseudomonadales bacterium]
MQFRKNLLCSNISLILTTSAALLQPWAGAFAQSTADNGQWTCRADAEGNWVCAENPVQARSAVTRNVVIGRREERADSQSSTSVTAASAPANALDWLTLEQMSEEQRASVASNCCGAFIEPARTGVDGQPIDPNASPDGATTQFSAPGAVNQGSDNTVSISGNVSIQQGYRTVRNSAATRIDQNTDTITLSGNVEFREPGILLRGDSAFVDQGNNINRIEHADYVLHEYGIHGAANVLVYDSNGEVLAIENGEFSRCEPGSEFWVLQAEQMTLDTQAGIGSARSVTLRMKDVPVFHYPFTVPFPLGDQRVSGLLAPSIGSTSDGGFDYAQPYYLNLAPHYDATITPRFIADRGVMASAEFRYLADWSMNTVSLALLPDDKRYDPATANLPGTRSPDTSKRWFVGLQHNGQLGEHWSTELNYEAVSDDRYFRDLGSSGLTVSSRTYLQRRGQLNYRTNHWYAGTRVQRIDIIDPYISASDLNLPYDRLPEFMLGGEIGLGGLQLGFDANHVDFDRSLSLAQLTTEQIDNGALVTGSRAHIEPRISFPIRGQAGFFVPTAKYKYTNWSLEQQALGTEDNPDRGVGVFSLDTGLVFERPMNRGEGFIQTLEPRLYYLYSEQQDQSLLPTFDTAQLNFSFAQLFRDDRFSGHDRIGDANQLSLALGSRFLNGRGEEKGRIAIGQIFYLEDRIVSLDSPVRSWVTLQPRSSDRSALVSEGVYQFSDTWRFNADVQWNEDQQRIDEGSAALRFQSDNNHIFNLAYRYRLLVDLYGPVPVGLDPRIKQTDISGVWPLNAQWRLLGRWHYDHSNSRNLDSFAGVEYSNCCATVRLIAREWIDENEFFLLQDRTKSGVFFQLTLNGLGNISGGGISRLLSDGILGFKEYEANE